MRTMKARRPRIRPRSSFTPIALIPPKAAAAARRPARRDRLASALMRVAPRPRRSAPSPPVGDLEEQLLEVGRGRAKLTIGILAAIASASSRRRRGLVAPETDLDLAVVEPPRGATSASASNRARAASTPSPSPSTRTRSTSPTRSLCPMSAIAALGEDAAAVDDRDARCTAPRARGGCGC